MINNMNDIDELNFDDFDDDDLDLTGLGIEEPAQEQEQEFEDTEAELEDEYEEYDDFEDESYDDDFEDETYDDEEPESKPEESPQKVNTNLQQESSLIEDADEDTDEESDEESDDISIMTNSFTDEFGNIVVQDKDGENFRLEYIPIKDISVPSKRVRKDAGVDELVTSIKTTGLLCPIVVAPLATVGKYVLIKGKRRLLACAKTGKQTIPCIINTKIKTTEIPIIEALYNHFRAYSVKEIIDYIDYLEKEKGIRRGDTIEYLLQLNSGEYAKLKDILTDNDEDIVSKLLQGQLTIEQAFRALEKRRKNETKEQQQLDKAEKVFNETEASGLSDIENSGDEAGAENLTDEEIKKLNIDLNNLDSGLDDVSLDDMVEEGKQMEGFEAHQQDVKHRERMDPAIRKAILVRDNYTCQCCELGGQSYINQLDTHHVVPVFLGGKDEVENGTTLCVLCHSLVHSWSTGELHIPKSKSAEELAAMDDTERVRYELEQKRFKRVIKLGNYIREGMKLKGIKKEQMRKITHEVNPGRNKPGQGQKADV